MCRIIELLPFSNMLRLIALFVVIVSLNGCTTMTKAPEEPLVPIYAEEQLVPEDVDKKPVSGYVEDKVELNEFSVAKGDDVIGRLIFITLEKGDTLPDIARHFSLGLDGVSDANPGVDVWSPEAGERVMLPLSFILPDAPRKGIVINLATMRLFEYKEDRGLLTVLTYPVGVGTEEKPSPKGLMRVVRKVHLPTWYVPTSIAKAHLKKGDPLPATVPPGPQNPLGEYALYLSAPSYLIHGTNKPASIGLRATNGCIRLYPESVKKLYEATPVKTTVNMVNQPYLLGQRDGVVYLEAHVTTEDSNGAELEKIYAKLKKVEKKSGRMLDWNKIDTVLVEARGIPVPISEIRQESGKIDAMPMDVKHPGKLFGRPEIPELKSDAWSVLVADVRDKKDALRLSAIINHQGPPIPARVISEDGSYRVVAGPFNTIKDTKDAIKRLKIDLELDGKLIEPIKQEKGGEKL